MLLRTKPKATGISSPVKGTAGRGAGSDPAAWELRPGGMLVQKRNSDSNQNSIPVPTIKVKVKYGPSIHEIHITPHASFGNCNSYNCRVWKSQFRVSLNFFLQFKNWSSHAPELELELELELVQN